MVRMIVSECEAPNQSSARRLDDANAFADLRLDVNVSTLYVDFDALRNSSGVAIGMT